MNRSDLVEALKRREDLSRREAEAFIDVFFHCISDALAQKQRIEIRGFGSFTIKGYKPYTGRNPKTGRKISVPSKRLPFFRVGKHLRDNVNTTGG
jgi:integration host factor subunit beta